METTRRIPRMIASRLAAAAVALASGLALGADRVALLIGNNTYATSPLRNATNDAKDLSEALKELGFKVIVRENATRKDMIEAIREFGTALEGANTALFFYAGHAMQFKDRNYLVPIDAAMGSEEDVTFFSMDVSQVFDRMDRARTRFNFIVLDACRDNPFASSFKVTSAGLAQMSAPSGTLIAYATSPGSVAADGFGRNGIYTKHILQHIKVPDLPVEIMFKRVREGVERETRKLQTPWDSSSLKGDFVFASAGRTATAAQAPAGPSADITLQIEREFWVSVRDSSRPEDIRAYLDKYPNGNFASLAKNRLDALVRPTRVAAAEPKPSPVPAESRPAAASTPPLPGGGTTASSSRTTSPAQEPPGKPAEPPAAEAPVNLAAAAPPPAASRPRRDPLSASPASAVQPQPSSTESMPASSVPSAAPAAAPASPPKPPPDLQPGREIAPGVREVAFADGAIYRGGMRGSSYHGKGEFVSKAFQYQGEFSEGFKHGKGVYVWQNGDRYEGTFAKDRADGQGKYQFANGDTYEGEVKAGVILGRGTYTAKNGDVFEGSFAAGKPHGVGIYRFASGDRYEGEMVEGRLQGKGRYVNKAGDRIEAPFVDGKPHGRGIYHFANGDRFEGDITDGALTGQGTYFYGSGLKYEGEVRAGQPQGKGVFWFQDGSRFEGTFDNGLARAKGEIVRADGTRAPAEIVDGNAKLLN